MVFRAGTPPSPRPTVDTRPAETKLTDVDTTPEVDENDAFTGTSVKRQSQPGDKLTDISDEGRGVLLKYKVAGQPVHARISEAGVEVQVSSLAPRQATPVELMMLNTLAQRTLLGAEGPQRALLEKAVSLIGQDARARFALPGTLPARDVTRSDLATANVALTRPTSVDAAFDKLVSTAHGTALVRRMTDNVMAWNMKWDLVNKASKRFDFSYFSIERDPYGYAYMGALLAAKLRGVDVRGITDWGSNSSGHGFSMAGLGADYAQELASYGVDLRFYNRPENRFKQFREDGVTFGVLASDHDKLAVADAGTDHAEGETGGRNVAGAYHQDPKDNPMSWRDDSVQIRGKDVTQGLLAALDREMDGPAVTRVRPDRVNVKPRATELLVSYQMMESWMRGAPLTDAEKAEVRANPAKKQALADALFEDAVYRTVMMNAPDAIKLKGLTRAETRALKARALELANDVELKGSRGKYDALDNYVKAEVKILDQTGAASAKPGDRYNEIGPGILQLMRGARKHIVIENPYVVMTEPMMEAFEEAAKRGVRIDIVTNSPESTDSAVTQGFFLNDWKNFLDRVPTARIMVATGQRKFHTKAFVIDGKVSADTSYNADIFSSLVNGEVGAVSRSEPYAQDLLNAIQADLDEPANKFKEWSIKRDADGKAIKGEDGQPIAEYGPETDVNAKLLKRYKPMQLLTRLASKFELLSPLRHDKG